MDGSRDAAFGGMYCSWGKIVPRPEAIKARTISQTPTFTEEKKFHVLSTIDLLYVCDRRALPSYRMLSNLRLSLPSICWFSSMGLPHASHSTVPSGLTCPHSHFILFIRIPLAISRVQKFASVELLINNLLPSFKEPLTPFNYSTSWIIKNIMGIVPVPYLT